MPGFYHGFNKLGRRIGAHVVIYPAPGKDNFRVIPDSLGFMGEIIRVHTNAVPANQAGFEGQEIPLGSGCRQHFMGINLQPREDHRKLIHQRDIQITLGILDNLCRLSHLDRTGLMGAGGNNTGIKRIHFIGNLRSRTGGDFHNAGYPVFFITRINTLGAVTGVKVPVKHQAGDVLQNRHADFLGCTRVYRGFINHDIALF